MIENETLFADIEYQCDLNTSIILSVMQEYVVLDSRVAFIYNEIINQPYFNN